MLEVAEKKPLTVQQFIIYAKDKAKTIISKSLESYVFDSSLNMVVNKAPTNKIEITSFLKEVNEYYSSRKAHLSLTKNLSDIQKKDSLLITAFIAHIYYIFNFEVKNKAHEKYFNEFLKLYESNRQYILGDKKTELYSFLVLNHNVNFLTERLKKEKTRQVMQELKMVLSLLDKYIDSTQDASLVAEACILTSTTRTSTEIILAYARQDSVWNFHQAVLDCQKAETALAKDPTNPIIHVVNAQKFIAQYYDWDHNQMLRECTKNPTQKHNSKSSANIDKNKINNQEAMLLFLEDIKTDQIIKRIEKDPKKMQSLTQFLFEIYNKCNIDDGFKYQFSYGITSKIDNLEGAYTRGITLIGMRLISKLLRLQKELLRNNCIVYRKAIHHYTHSEILAESLSEKSEECMLLLTKWEQAITNKIKLFYVDDNDNSDLATIKKKMDEIKVAREQAEKEFIVAQQNADKIFSELMSDCIEKELMIEEKCKKELESLKERIDESRKENIEDHEDKNIQSLAPTVDVKLESQLYSAGEKAFHKLKLVNTYKEKMQVYQDAIDCFAASISKATANPPPDYTLIAKAHSFIADCNLGLANLAYDNKHFIDSINFRTKAIEENLPKSLAQLSELEKIKTDVSSIKSLKESINFQIQTFQLDAIAYESLITEKLAIREKGREEAMKRLGNAWFKGKKLNTLSYFARERIELSLALNNFNKVKEKINALYRQSTKVDPSSLLPLLNKSLSLNVFSAPLAELSGANQFDKDEANQFRK